MDADPGRPTGRMAAVDEVEIGDRELRFDRYLFYPASVRTRPVVPAPAIGEIDLTSGPPAVRLKRELLFVSAERKEELEQFARRNGIPVRRRFDVWAALLEPFLDTQFDDVHSEKTFAALEHHGVGRNEAGRIRACVERRMNWLTFFTWEWLHYGLYDVLFAMQPFLVGRGRFCRFYLEAMDVALRSYR